MGVRAVAETIHDEQPQVTRLKLLAVAPEPPAANNPQRPDPTPEAPRPRPRTRSPDEAALMATLASILGFRVQLLLAFLGAAGIGGYAVATNHWQAILVFVFYGLLVFLPVLEAAKKRG